MFICSASKNCHGLLQKSLVTRRSGKRNRFGCLMSCVLFAVKKYVWRWERRLMHLAFTSVRSPNQMVTAFQSWYKVSKRQTNRLRRPSFASNQELVAKIAILGRFAKYTMTLPLGVWWHKAFLSFQMMSEWMLKRVIALLNHTFENARLVDKIEVKGTKRMFCNTK